MRERLRGRWRLESYEASGQGGTVHPMGREAAGVLDYSADGKVSVHIMARDGRYFAYYGDYTIDEAAATVTHRIELSSEPGFVGASNLRHAALEGDRLTLTGPMTLEGAPHTIRVIWRRESPG